MTRLLYYLRVAEDLLIRGSNRAMAGIEYAHLAADRVLFRRPHTPRFLLIKALGAGFFSDVTVVLDALLFCRLSGRIPVTHWGRESRFGDGSGEDAFSRHFYEPLSPFTVADLAQPGYRYFPPGWNEHNLARAHPLDRIRRRSDVTAGNYRLLLRARHEVLVIKRHHRPADYAGAIHSLLANDPELAGRPLLEVYRFLARRHLTPRPEITAAVEAFRQAHLGDEPYLAVHVRGADKVLELAGLADLNARYDALIAGQMQAHGFERFLLLTDDERLAARYRQRYGSQVVLTNAQRTSSETIQALYRDKSLTNPRLGREVMLDAYLAAGASAFIGNSASAVSLMVGILGGFPAERLIYLAPREGILNFDAASYQLCTAIPVPEAHYNIIFT